MFQLTFRIVSGYFLHPILISVQRAEERTDPDESLLDGCPQMPISIILDWRIVTATTDVGAPPPNAAT